MELAVNETCTNLQEGEDIPDGKILNNARRYGGKRAVGVVVGADLPDPEQRFVHPCRRPRCLHVLLEPPQLRHQRLRCHVDGDIVLHIELVLDRRRPCHREVHSMQRPRWIACNREVRRQEWEGEGRGEEVDD